MEKDEKLAFDQFNKLNTMSRDASSVWIKTVITILTPSLVLLIGLQDKNQSLSCIALFFLIASIVILTLTILLGLFVLSADAKGFKLLRDKTAKQWKNDKSLCNDPVLLSKKYKYANIMFEYLSFCSIPFLCFFGICKYIF